MTARTIFASALLLLCGASAAHAATKVMGVGPASRFYPAGQTLTCTILNLNTTTKTVTVEAMDYFGGVVVSGGGPLAPNASTSISDPAGNGAWCRFTVDGSTKKYRAAALYDNGTEYTTGHAAH